jgi:hypothetical protein
MDGLRIEALAQVVTAEERPSCLKDFETGSCRFAFDDSRATADFSASFLVLKVGHCWIGCTALLFARHSRYVDR